MGKEELQRSTDHTLIKADKANNRDQRQTQMDNIQMVHMQLQITKGKEEHKSIQMLFKMMYMPETTRMMELKGRVERKEKEVKEIKSRPKRRKKKKRLIRNPSWRTGKFICLTSSLLTCSLLRFQLDRLCRRLKAKMKVYSSSTLTTLELISSSSQTKE